MRAVGAMDTRRRKPNIHRVPNHASAKHCVKHWYKKMGHRRLPSGKRTTVKAHKFTTHEYIAHALKAQEHEGPRCIMNPPVSAAGPQGQCSATDRTHEAGRGTAESSSYGMRVP